MDRSKATEHETGQNLVIFAVLLVVLVILAGLVIDGGFGLVKRREAQNAADAGALAGATALCEGDPSLAESQAIDYAVNRNHASTARVDIINDSVVVTATVEHKTFFMGLFGSSVISPTASASAGCYVPCNVSGVLPVAWLCATPPEPGQESCGIHYGPEDQSEQLYVIMDSQKAYVDACQNPPGNPAQPDLLNCDTNGDGYDEIIPGGQRGWLDLDGHTDPGTAGGAQQLKTWIRYGFGGDLTQHTWYGGKGGQISDLYNVLNSTLQPNNIYLLPVYNEVPCNGLPNINCPGEFHTSAEDGVQDQIVQTGGTSQLYYHVITFSAFRVTCVWQNNSSPACPGRNAALDANANLPKNTTTIEGYFIKYNAGEGRCEGPDTGIHTIYLNR